MSVYGTYSVRIIGIYYLSYFDVYAQLYMHIRTTYVQYTAWIVYYTDMMYIICTLQYMFVCCMYMHVYDFLEPYVALIGAVCVCISKSYVQILTPCWGERMYVYARTCKYF
jgi:hypothetical protein